MMSPLPFSSLARLTLLPGLSSTVTRQDQANGRRMHAY